VVRDVAGAGLNGMVGNGQHHQQNGAGGGQQQSVPTYKWMQVKRNVPKPG
jgi:hypothetical protein